MKLFVFSLLLLTCAPFAHASDPYKEIDDARIARDQQKYPFLYRGFRFLIQPASDGGLSIAGLYDGDGGFVLCYSAQDPSNGADTAPFHCNVRITPPGFHVPADVVFGHPGFLANLKDVLRVGGEFVLNAAGTVTQFNPVVSEVATTGANATGQTPIQEMIGSYQIKNTMDRLYASAMQSMRYCDVASVSTPAPFNLDDLANDLRDRVRKFQKKCASHKVDLSSKADVTDPNFIAELSLDPKARDRADKDGGEEIFCHEQEYNVRMAAEVEEICNIPEIDPLAGETGNPELWFPGQPVTSACKQALLNYTAKDEKGADVLISGKPVPIGAPMLAWLKYQSIKVKGVAPATADAAAAQHVGQCLINNPDAEKIAEKLQEDLEDGRDLPTQEPISTRTTTTRGISN